MGCDQHACQPHLFVRSNRYILSYLLSWSFINIFVGHDYHYTDIGACMHIQPISALIIYVV